MTRNHAGCAPNDRRTSPRPRRTVLGPVGDRRGFTLIEMLTVVVVIGILANIALPMYRNVTQRADAAKVISDYHAIHVGAYSLFAATNQFPPTGVESQVPVELVPFLPEGFRFTYKNATYRWRRYSLPAGPPSGGSQPWLVALTVRSSDPVLLQAIENQFGGIITGYVGDNLTMLFE